MGLFDDMEHLVAFTVVLGPDYAEGLGVDGVVLGDADTVFVSPDGVAGVLEHLARDRSDQHSLVHHLSVDWLVRTRLLLLVDLDRLRLHPVLVDH